MDKPEKKQKIQWDEETIAEHDKERGSRQKIDEAPTPFRYHSESDQSECESDGERLARRDLEDAADAAASNSPRDPQTNKKKSLPTNPHSVGDSWEAINAKLQYEKHLQDSVGATNPSMMLGKPNDSLLRSQFYQHSGSNSNNNFGSHTHSQTGSPRVSMAGSAKIQDLQSNFGEILNPAPAAFSPQFTNKNFRRANGSGSSSATKASILVAGSASADDESGGAGSGAGMHGSEGPSPKRKPLTPEKPPKSVFIKAFAEGEGQGHGEGHGHGEEAIGGNTDAMDGSSPRHHSHDGHDNGHDTMFAGINGSADEDLPSSGEKKQFLNKRAGHYNEFKVLQAMRAKLAAEEDEDEEGEDENDS